MTRWQQFYSDDNRLAAIPSSMCADEAAQIFANDHSQVILDLGCGAGRDSFLLASSGAQVIGLDAAHSGLLLAQKRAAAQGTLVAWVESDSRTLPFADGLFEGVYCFGLLHEFVGETAASNVRRTMAEMYPLLRGTAVVAVSAGDPQKRLPHG